MSDHQQNLKEPQVEVVEEGVKQSGESVENLVEEVVEEIPKSLEEANKLKQEANDIFKENDFPGAIEAYQKAIRVCPIDQKQLLCILNSNISICYMKINDNESLIEYGKKAVDYNPSYRKAWLNIGNAYNQTQKYQEALEAYKKAMELQNDASFDPIIKKLNKKVDQINEKRKTEVMDGLKSIGNSILGYFNLSLDNFKMNQNSDGTYGMSFQQ